MRATPSVFLRTAVLFAVSSAFTLFPCAPCSEAQSASAAPATTPQAVGVRPLITEALDEGHLTVLKGNTHPLARPEFDLGTAPASLPMERMLLVLKRSPQQETALRRLLDDQQDKASPNYHKWLTPAKFGKQFGPSDADIQTITSWLQSHGFQVSPTKGRTLIEFSGSASQVQEAFHTPIHKYVVNGEQHWANSSDPQIPAALAPATAGALTLHDFVKKPQIHVSNDRGTLKIVPGKKPLVTFPPQNGQPILNALGPQDYATIYNINPTYNAFINGNFITIGIVGRSNLFNGGQDVRDFHCSVFPGNCGGFGIILNGPDPGDLGGGDEAEATLDSTWAGSIAPSATVDLVVSASTNTTDGIDLSELYIVENNLADVMTESFGGCEYFATDAQVSGTNALAEQAAAQGITYLVSTGDNGAAGCDDPNSQAAVYPLSVNFLASTPFNVAVGGTMFNENGQQSKYWGSAAPVNETAISYIPEDVWNESCSNAACGANANLSAGSGGVSSGDAGTGGTFTGFPKPVWQSGVTGIPNDNVRDLPDVSLTAAGHDPYLLCLDGSCSQGFIYFVWGTSASAPSFAGIMALVDEQMQNLYGAQARRQGQANYVLYRLAASQEANGWLCNGSNTTTLPDISNCIFNDTTIGNNAVPGELNYGLPSAKYQAGVGYDLATGLGSVNVANLVKQWNTVTFNPTTTTLTLNNGAAVNVVHGVPVNVSILVAPNSSTNVPTGDVALLANTGPSFTLQTAVDGRTLSSGQAVFSTTQLPGGTYSVSAHYAGDATFAPSDSTPTTVTVSSEGSVITLSGPFTQDKFGLYTVPFTTLPFGSPVFIRADVQGTSKTGTPTGTVTFNATVNGTPGTIPNGNPAFLNSEGNASVQSNPFLLNGPIVPFDAGQYTISATYSGDASFQTSGTTQSVSFAIQPGFLTSLGAAPLVNISSAGLSGSIPINVFASTGFTSAINFTCAGLPAESTCTFGPTSITGSGQILVTVSTTAPHLTQLLEQHPYYFARWLTGGFALAGVFVLGSPRRRRHSLPLLLIILALLLMIPACGGGGGSHHQQDPGTPTGSYNVTVSATSGSLLQTTAFTLSVQ